METKLDLLAGKAGKKSLQYLGIVLVIAILVCIGSFYFLSQIPETEEEIIPEKSEKGEAIKQQLQDLDRLKGDVQPLTEEEIQEQLKELEQLQQKTQPLTEEEIQKQLEELDKLH